VGCKRALAVGLERAAAFFLVFAMAEVLAFLTDFFMGFLALAWLNRA
jgi:hypothetical protein